MNQLPYMKLPKSYRQDAFKEEYENAIVLRKMLKEYRKCKNRDFENISCLAKNFEESLS